MTKFYSFKVPKIFYYFIFNILKQIRLYAHSVYNEILSGLLHLLKTHRSESTQYNVAAMNAESWNCPKFSAFLF